MDLKKSRDNIDRIDEKILNLLNKRALEAINIAKLKKDKNLKGYSPERESSMLKHLKQLNKGVFSSEDIEIVFREILSVCRAQRTTLEIAYLGPQGTFTNLAAIKKFGKKPNFIPSISIADVFDKVTRGEADYGVVPIENSTEGAVNHTFDMFLESNLNICAEEILNISHALIGTTKKGIKKIYSNPQVFAQCRNWISLSLKNVQLIPTVSTAKAAQEAKKNSSSACIGNKALANIYGLKVIASNIEDSPHNCTRFLIIAKNDSPSSGEDKTSIVCSINDRVGALYDVLFSFKSFGINLTRIESRPSKKKAWEYYFFVDFEGHRNNELVQKALKKLSNECKFVNILGSYPKGN